MSIGLSQDAMPIMFFLGLILANPSPVCVTRPKLYKHIWNPKVTFSARRKQHWSRSTSCFSFL